MSKFPGVKWIETFRDFESWSVTGLAHKYFKRVVAHGVVVAYSRQTNEKVGEYSPDHQRGWLIFK